MPVLEEANWYKPEPGEPYRPLIAMPSQLKQKIPWLSFCEDSFFTAYDPPIALMPATMLGPVTTPGSDPKAQTSIAVPSPTLDLGARKTAFPTLQKTPPSLTHFASESSSDPKQGSYPSEHPECRESLRIPSLPLQTHMVANANQDFNHNTDSVLYNRPEQSNNADQTEGESGQQATPASPATDAEVTPPTVIHQDPKSGVISINNLALQPLSQGISIAGTTLTPGASPITVSSSRIYFDSSVLMIGTSTLQLAPQVPQRVLTTIAGHVITAAPTAVVIADTIMNPGDAGVTLGGTLIGFNKAGQVLLGSKTISLASGLPEVITTAIAGQAITADPTAVVVTGTTLRPGDPAMTVDGTPVALDPAGHLLVASKTILLRTASAPPLVTTIAGQVIAAAANAITIAGTTLEPGDAGFPLNGTTISLDKAGRFVVGAKTHTFESESGGLVGLIEGASGTQRHLATFVPSATQQNFSIETENATSTSVQEFKGGAEILKDRLPWMKAVAAVSAMVVLLKNAW